MVVRPFLATDFQAIYQLDQEHFPFPWGEKQWQEVIEGPSCLDYQLLILDDRGLAQGLVLYRKGPDQWHLLKILVAPMARRSKGGSLLIQKAFEYDIYLEVSAENLPAVHFYQTHGFETVARKKKFYSNGEDALAMVRKANVPK